MNDKCSVNKGLVVWFTGLSGAGKSTIAEKVYELLSEKTGSVEMLDGDVLRGQFPNTGFGKQDRDDHILRVGFMASLLARHGVIVVASFISPYRATRDKVREMCGDRFAEIFVNAPLAECEKRDVKGLYKRARSGEIKNFTGIDDPYEEPLEAEMVIRTDKETVEDSAGKVMDYIESRGVLE